MGRQGPRLEQQCNAATQQEGPRLELGVVAQHERLEVGGVDVVQALLRVAVRCERLLRAGGGTLSDTQPRRISHL